LLLLFSSAGFCIEFLVADEIAAVHVAPAGPLADFARNAAAFAVSTLNEKPENINDPFEIESVDLSNANFGTGTSFSGVVEFSNHFRTELLLLKPTQAVPEIADVGLLLGTGQVEDYPAVRPLVMDALSLDGPFGLSFQGDATFRLPHLVDPGDVKRVQLSSGASVNITGVSSVRLLSPVEVELRLGSSTPRIVWSQVPQLHLNGTNLGFLSQHRTKMNRIGAQSVQLTNPDTNQPVTVRNSFDLLDQVLLQQLQQLQMRALSESPNLQIRRLVEGSASAIRLVLLPVELIQPATGIHSLWRMLVTQDAAGNFRLVSHEQQMTKAEVTLSNMLLTNGTWTDVVSTFQNSQALQAR